jgi:hypothetical protein
VRILNSAWVSEHLSFNAIQVGNKIEQVGFLLPPRQTAAGVELAVRNINMLCEKLPVPFAFENGVNYLQPSSDEMSDGEFFTTVAEKAKCGILLDIHNLWVNERNGRQSVADVIGILPLERVWEIHFAGGMMLGDYYLDAHSDVIAPELFEIAERLLPKLPSVGALIFEILPEHVARVGLDRVRNQVRRLRDLWELRPVSPARNVAGAVRTCTWQGDIRDVAEWEKALGTLAVGHNPTGLQGEKHVFSSDRGVELLGRLIGEFRFGRIVRTMKFTITLIMLRLGHHATRELLKEYERSCFPDIFAGGEADRFARFLRNRMDTLPSLPFLKEVLNFEHAVIRARLFEESTQVEWSIDPSLLFESLEMGCVPPLQDTPKIVMNIVPGS